MERIRTVGGVYGPRSASGAVAGLLAGVVYVTLQASLDGAAGAGGLGEAPTFSLGAGAHLLLSVLMGVVYAWLFRPASYADSVSSGVAYALVWWMLVPLSLGPALAGVGPQWEAVTVAAALPVLLGYVVQGALLGLGYYALLAAAARWLGLPLAAAVVPRRPVPVQHRIAILGGGFAGVTAGQHLERLFRHDERVAITLVSSTNHLLFTPMLSEVTASGVEAQHIGPPLRTFFGRTRVVQAEVEAVDLAKGTVRLASGRAGRDGTEPPGVRFDQLVLALGTVPSFFGNQDIERHAFTFKSLGDAILLRNHVIEMLERADAEPDAGRRRALLTFVVAGGGFAGAELIGGLNDFVRGSLWFYPRARPEEVSVVLVHSGERILPELSAELAEYARARLADRGVTCRLGVRLAGAGPGTVALNNGEMIEAETLVWTAGNAPHPLLKTLGVALDNRGAVKTDETLAVLGGGPPAGPASATGAAGRSGRPEGEGVASPLDGAGNRRVSPRVWAVGDCAAVPDVYTGRTAPPTAQHALREAKTVAHNVHAAIRGKPLKPYRYRSLGSLAVLGHQTACAELYGRKFSGLLAWWMWRMVYLGKLPSLEKRVRVALDWLVDIFFPRDIVQIHVPERDRREPEARTRAAAEQSREAGPVVGARG